MKMEFSQNHECHFFWRMIFSLVVKLLKVWTDVFLFIPNTKQRETLSQAYSLSISGDFADPVEVPELDTIGLYLRDKTDRVAWWQSVFIEDHSYKCFFPGWGKLICL